MDSAGEVGQQQPLRPGRARTNRSWACLSQVQRKLTTWLEIFIHSIAHCHFLQRSRLCVYLSITLGSCSQKRYLTFSDSWYNTDKKRIFDLALCSRICLEIISSHRKYPCILLLAKVVQKKVHALSETESWTPKSNVTSRKKMGYNYVDIYQLLSTQGFSIYLMQCSFFAFWNVS